MGARKKKQNEAQEAEKKQDPPRLKIENFSRDLRVALKREEIEERAERAAHLLADRDLKEAEHKEIARQQKGRIAEMETEIRRLSNEVRDKATYRDVPCERRYLYDEKKIVEVRCDTGEVIYERAMTEAELQREFSFSGGDVDDEFGEGEAAE